MRMSNMTESAEVNQWLTAIDITCNRIKCEAENINKIYESGSAHDYSFKAGDILCEAEAINKALGELRRITLGEDQDEDQI